MRFIAILTLALGLSGCASVDEYLVKPSVTMEDGSVVEGQSKAEVLVDKYDDQALLVTPTPYKWAVPVIGGIVAIASTVATRLRRKDEEIEVVEEQAQEGSDG